MNVTDLSHPIVSIEAAVKAGTTITIDPEVLLRLMACHRFVHVPKPISRVDDARARARLASIMVHASDADAEEREHDYWIEALRLEAMDLMLESCRVEHRLQPERCSEASELAASMGRADEALSLAARGLGVTGKHAPDEATRAKLVGRLLSAAGQAEVASPVALILAEAMSGTLKWQAVPERVALTVVAREQANGPWSADDTEAGAEDTDEPEVSEPDADADDEKPLTATEIDDEID